MQKWHSYPLGYLKESISMILTERYLYNSNIRWGKIFRYIPISIMLEHMATCGYKLGDNVFPEPNAGGYPWSSVSLNKGEQHHYLSPLVSYNPDDGRVT